MGSTKSFFCAMERFRTTKQGRLKLSWDTKDPKENAMQQLLVLCDVPSSKETLKKLMEVARNEPPDEQMDVEQYRKGPGAKFQYALDHLDDIIDELVELGFLEEGNVLKLC